MGADGGRKAAVGVTSDMVDGLAALTLRSTVLSVTVIPQLGGKIISVRRVTAGGGEEEVLWRNAVRRLVAPPYGATFEHYDASAFDDCFPGIAAGPFPAPAWRGVANPDHGEVWALPWQAEAVGAGLRLAVHGVRFPYLLEREIAFQAPDRLALRYRVTNHAALDLPYIWSAHPLFAVTPSTRIMLPAGVTTLTIDSSMGGRLGQPYSTIEWPLATASSGQQVDLSRLTRGAGHGDKLYTTAPLDEGWAALYDEATGGYAGFAFDPREVPYLGVWINQDGWPAEGPSCFNVALEPCTGWPDDLAQAAGGGTLRTLPPFGSHSWTIVLAAGHAPSADDVRRELRQIVIDS